MRFLPVILVLGIFGCEGKVRPSVVPLSTKDPPSQESWRSTVIFSDSARVNAILWAGHIAVYAEREYTLLDDSIHVDLFDRSGNHTSVLTARRGKVEDRTRDFEAYENVVVTSDSGTILKTDRLFWDDSEGKIHTDAFVEIISPTEHIRGHGFVSDQSLKQYRIFRVTGESVENQ
ncbi:MAG: LPS export ABC transporter periplasmic protein LptC [Bacteroidota bacterium]